MATRAEQKQLRRDERRKREEQQRHAERARTLRMRAGGALVAAIAILGVIFLLSNKGGSTPSATKAGKYAFAVGNPGLGQPAPPISLPSTQGTTFDLGAQRGKTVMLYFQEGLGCQPCWDQLKDIEHNMPEIKALGIDKVVSITSDPLGAIRQKVSDDGISTPVLSDPKLAVSKTYSANQYGMMGTSRDGHSFIVVGPDGKIRQRMDYGGAPNYTMYVPVRSLVADLRKGLDRPAS